MSYKLLEEHVPAILQFAGNAQDERLLLAQERSLSVYYSPFEYVNPEARIVLVGITPGKVQAVNALNEAKRCLKAGLPLDDVARLAKETGAFSGAMRPNLIALLNRIGIAKWLGIIDCKELFGASGHLLQTASALQFPVLVGGDNYNGTPDPTSSSLLRAQLTEHFGEMARRLSDAIYVPLGPVPTKAIEWLAEQGLIDRNKVVAGLQHPSGANAERIAYFLGSKSREQLSAKTNATKLDGARAMIDRQVAQLSLS